MAIQFTLSDVTASYTKLNIEQRQKAKNSFDTDFWKLMSNSVHGKSMESVCSRQNIKLYSE